MALGNKGNTNGNLIILKPVTKVDGQQCKPFFEVKRKVDGVWMTDEDGVTSVSGDLTKVETETREWDGSEFATAKIFLEDKAENELYLIDLRFNIATRSLFNALINVESFDDLSISIYENDNGYANFSIWQNDEMIRWKYSLDDIPAPTETTFKGKKLRDYSETDEFFSNKLDEFAEKVGEAPKSDPSPSTAPETAPEEEEDDIPF